MLKNTYVRIAVIVVLVILLYYLVVTLARSVSGAEAEEGPVPSRSRLAEYLRAV